MYPNRGLKSIEIYKFLGRVWIMNLVRKNNIEIEKIDDSNNLKRLDRLYFYFFYFVSPNLLI